MRQQLKLFAWSCGAIAAGVFLGIRVYAGDWPQHRGAARDGITAEKVATTWTRAATGPRELWRAEVGRGHAAVSVAEGRAITLGYSGKGDPLNRDAGMDAVWCFDAATGKQLWKYEYPAIARIKAEPGGGAYDGPHAAPLIVKDRVYTLSRDAQVICLDAAKGTLVWKRDLMADDKAKLPECGFAGAPLALDNHIVVSVGAAGTALDAATGQTRWKSDPEIAGYASPTVATDSKGTRRLLLFGARELVAVTPEDGTKLWSVSWPTSWGVNAVDPVAVGDSVFITSAYARGCALVDLADGKVRYKNKVLATHCSPLILREGAIYGFSGYIDGSAKNRLLVCIDPLKGSEHWRQEGMAGQMILADDKLVIVLTTGELVIAEATTRGYRELSRVKVSEKEPCPVPPALANGRLYLRSGKGVVRCLEAEVR